LLDRQFNDVDIPYLQELPESGLRENVSLEFKRQIERKESLLKEVCAFANTIGGDLLIGIEEEDGEPSAVLGVQADNLSRDAYELRLSQQIRSGIEPTVPFYIHCHQLENESILTHIRVEQSLIGPHRLVATHKFFERVSSSSVEMSMDNLREAFGALSELESQALAHHQIRISNNPYIGHNQDAVTVYIHIIPVASLRRRLAIPVTSIPPLQLVQPPGLTYTHSRIDHRGYMLRTTRGDINIMSHTGRNGIVEGAFEILPREDDHLGQALWWVPVHDQWVTNFAGDVIQFLRQHGENGPAFICVSLKNSRGLRGYRDRLFRNEEGAFLEETLNCEPTYLENLETEGTTAMKKSLDVIWNGLGYQKSPNYDGDGNWVPVHR